MFSSQTGQSPLSGLVLCFAVSGAGYAVTALLQRFTGQTPVDALVWCILIGTLINTVRPLPARFAPGIHMSAKLLLEIAIVLLGASISLKQIAGNGAGLIVAVVAVVIMALTLSYGIGRTLGLPHKLALLVACGNSICGNSAIVAAAPVIDAHADDVAASIAFTAALGILVVLGLPPLAGVMGLDPRHYGILAGMTVYAVPQVLAAAAPLGLLSLQTGTVVKLIRVMMLGPVLLMLGLVAGGDGKSSVTLKHLAPWFILGFFALMIARSFDILPHVALEPASMLSGLLTTVSMAALGLSVNLRSLMASGGRVVAAGALSILCLGTLADISLHFLG
ncbi:putative sulfate exporter family transporter [Allorhizobium sp. BGMRC 0089]|uniref:YeiH family protein n=1 Tax=Allorhizobium sonneratiae TaxID=2934936 RepID=UPI00203339ED|nr:putative sulfate exporter family transporter [Allorhizobium sonneratiae]MCM2293604.1 putative sulfate exporter family transporter [Allorhizobium sonneratiae]